MPFDQSLGFIFDYAWVLFALVGCAYAFIWKARAAKLEQQNPELKPECDRLLNSFVLVMNIPWIIIGIGMLVGGVPSTYSYFSPRSGNPFVLTFHAMVVILWLFSIWWIYFKGGAEILVRYKDIFNLNISSPVTIKLYVGMCLLGAVAGMVMMWTW